MFGTMPTPILNECPAKKVRLVFKAEIDEGGYWKYIRTNLWEDLLKTQSHGQYIASSSGINLVLMCGRDKIAVGCHEPVLQQCSSFLKEILNDGQVSKCFERTILLPDVRSDILWHCLKLIYKGETDANELELIDILELLSIFKIQVTFNTQTSSNAQIRNSRCLDGTSSTENNLQTNEDFILGRQMLNANVNTKSHVDDSAILFKVEIEEQSLGNDSLNGIEKQQMPSGAKLDSNNTSTDKTQQQSAVVNAEMERFKEAYIDAVSRSDEYSDQIIITVAITLIE